MQIENGSTVEFWKPDCTELEAFVGWCFINSEGREVIWVKGSARFYKDTQLHAEICPTEGTMYWEMFREQEQISNLQKQLDRSRVEIKNIKVKKIKVYL